MKRLFTIAFILAIVAPIAYAEKIKREPIKAYIIQPGSNQGFVDQNSKALSDSTEDLINSLGGKKGIAFVSIRESADITLEVVSRGMVESGSSVSRVDRNAFGGRQVVTESKEEGLSVRLSCGDYNTIIFARSGTNRDNVFGLRAWRQTADAAANQIDRWVKDNYYKIIEGRK